MSNKYPLRGTKEYPPIGNTYKLVLKEHTLQVTVLSGIITNLDGVSTDMSKHTVYLSYVVIENKDRPERVGNTGTVGFVLEQFLKKAQAV